MKYILVLMFLTSCSYSNTDTFQKEIEQINKLNRKNQLLMNVINCQLGVLITVKTLRRLLYKKVKRKELDSIWKECDKLGIDNG